MLETGKKIIESIFFSLLFSKLKKNSRKRFFFTCFFLAGKKFMIYNDVYAPLLSLDIHLKSSFPNPLDASSVSCWVSVVTCTSSGENTGIVHGAEE